MTPLEFLRAVWPATGIYALATPYHEGYAHKVWETIEEAAAFADARKGAVDMFFCVHTLVERSVWDPTKINPRTGEQGASAVRLQRNMREAKVFFFDLDVGPEAKKYQSQGDAVGALQGFLISTHLPKPMLVSSGGGVHVYWLLDSPIPSDEWRTHARKLKQLAGHYGLRTDPMRTTDTSSVLRVAGTINHKHGQTRSVETRTKGVISTPEVFVETLTEAFITAGLTPQATPTPHVHDPDGFEDNLVRPDYGPAPTLASVGKVCSQVRSLIKRRETVSEPEWYLTLNLVRNCEDGERLVHVVSKDYPGYNHDEVDKKVNQLVAKDIGAPTCKDIAEKCGDTLCQTCPHLGIKSPFSKAKFYDPAPAPVAYQLVGTTVVSTIIPDPPENYVRTPDGKIGFKFRDKDDKEQSVTILDYDLYPLKREVNIEAVAEQQLWAVVLPRYGLREFQLDAEALYDEKKFRAVAANIGMFPDPRCVPQVMAYMIAYIKKLQQENDASSQYNHLGWSEDHAEFILPDKMLCGDGSAKAVSLSLGAKRSSEFIRKKGTIEQQIAALSFYNRPAYIPNQFVILAALAAPLFYMTKQHGIIINLSGKSGASKSTTLYTGASLWGNPELYAINGTNKGMTPLARNALVATLANLPVCVDEITKMIPREAVDLAMNITQPGSRRALERSGVEKAMQGGYKSTIMISTANNSLHGLLSADNATGTAGSMRVFEIIMLKTFSHTKGEADDFWHHLSENYGHVGEVFIAYVVQNREAVEQRVREMIREIDLLARIDSSERFYSANTAVVVVAGQIAVELGLVPYDIPAIKNWVLYKQIPYMRGVVTEEYDTPLGTLTDYLETINGKTLVSRSPPMNSRTGSMGAVLIEPHGELLAHHDQRDNAMYILKKGFRDYCIKVGANSLQILDELYKPVALSDGSHKRIIVNKHCRKILGANTNYAKAQAWCFVIDVTHPDIAGMRDLSIVGSTQQPVPVNLKPALLKIVENT